MKTKCCRDTPRCASCPVRLVAAARKQKQASELAALVHEVFTGPPGPALPACVVAALDELDAARRESPALAAEARLP
jgi:hypothetical protein